MIPSIFSVLFLMELFFVLSLAISDCSKTSSKELEFDIHFVSLNRPSVNNFVTLTTVSFAKSISLFVPK